MSLVFMGDGPEKQIWDKFQTCYEAEILLASELESRTRFSPYLLQHQISLWFAEKGGL